MSASTFAIPQRLTHTQAMSVLESLRSAIASGTTHIDLSALVEFDSAALSVLRAARRLQRTTPLRCVNAPDKLRKLANLYGVDSLIFDDL